MKRSAVYLAIFSLLLDLLAIVGGMLVAYSLRAEGAQLYYWPFSSYFKFVLLLLPIWLIIFASQGLYNPRILPRGWNAIGKLLISLLGGWGAVLIILFFWHTPQAQAFPRLIIIYGIVWTTVLVMIGRILLGGLIGLLYRSGMAVLRTVVVGYGPRDEFVQALINNPVHGRLIVGSFSQGDYLEKLETLSRTTPFDEVLVTDAIDDRELLRVLTWAEDNGRNFSLVPTLLSVRTSNVYYGTLAGKPIMHLLPTPLDGWGRVYKRLLDLIIVTPALIVLSPLYLALYIAVKTSSPGPAIFKQARIGQNGQPFDVHKFRSMLIDGDQKYQMSWSSDEAKDPRVTPLGRFIRKTNLDELPQLWDIFTGLMSLVGPRPEQPQYVDRFTQEIPEYIRRHNVKSGLTGWAQVNGLRGDTSITERVKYDLYYIENWSIGFDLRIIISTVIQTLRQLFSRKK